MNKLGKTMRKLIDEYITYAIEHEKYTLDGNYKKGNIAHEKIKQVIEFIKNEKYEVRDEFYTLLNYDNDSVKIWTATTLLKTYEKECLEVLEKIAKENKTILSLNAKTCIDIWKKNLMTNLINWNNL